MKNKLLIKTRILLSGGSKYFFLFILLCNYSRVLSQTAHPGDSLLLVNFHKSLLDGGWSPIWDLSEPVSKWEGVTLDATGDVAAIILSGNYQNDQSAAVDNISSTSINYLVGLQDLKQLYLSGLGLKSIPKEIGDLSNLTTLTLGDNQLTTLPIEINNLNSLVHLSLTSNQFSNDLDISGLQALTDLRLYLNNITKIPNSIYQLQNLQFLRIGYNKNLIEMSSAIQYLTNLVELNISGASLLSIPEEIGLLENIVTLDFSFNNLSSIPNSIGDLSSLRTLKVADNNLSVLPDSLGLLRKLVTLDVSSNNLSSIPSNYDRLDFLDQIYFDDNEFTTFPDVLTKLSTIEVISGNNNQMSGSIPEDVFELERQIFLNNNNFTGDLILTSGMPSHIEIENNKFTLKNIKDIFLQYEVYEGHPYIYRKIVVGSQQKIGTVRTFYPSANDTFNLSIDNYTPLSDNTYSWYANGTLISNDETLAIPNFDGEVHSGFYHCIVTNVALPSLELYSNTVRVIGKDNPPSIVASDLELRVGNSLNFNISISDDFTPISELSFSFTSETELFNVQQLNSNFSGVITFQVTQKGTNIGTNEVIFTVVDEAGNETNKSINITTFPSENEAPKITLDTVYMVNLDTGNGPIPSCTPGTASCTERYAWHSGTNLMNYTTDDFTTLDNLTFEFSDTNTYPDVYVNFSGSTISAYVFGDNDTTFVKTIKVTDHEGMSFEKDVTFICNGGITTPNNQAPTVSAIEKQVISTGVTSFDTINLYNYVKDDYVGEYDFTFNILKTEYVTASVENGQLVVLPIDPSIPFIETIELSVHEKSNNFSFTDFKIVFEMEETSTLGIDTIEKDTIFTIYPNPNSGTMTFTLPQTDFKQGVLALYSSLGKLILNLPLNSGDTSYKLDSNVSAGIYHAVLYLDDKIKATTNVVVR